MNCTMMDGSTNIKVILYMLAVLGRTLGNLVVRDMCTSGVGLTQTFVLQCRRQIVWHQRHCILPTLVPLPHHPLMISLQLALPLVATVTVHRFLPNNSYGSNVSGTPYTCFLVRSKLSDSFLTGAQDSGLQRATIL
jgi:hypothetical protein